MNQAEQAYDKACEAYVAEEYATALELSRELPVIACRHGFACNGSSSLATTLQRLCNGSATALSCVNPCKHDAATAQRLTWGGAGGKVFFPQPSLSTRLAAPLVLRMRYACATLMFA